MHLDVKPCNYVFVKSDGDALKLIDFDGADLLLGFANNVQQNQSKIPEVVAHTKQYMSPEQDEHIFKRRRELSVKADIWAIGIIIYEIILQHKYYDYLFSKEEDLDVNSVLHYIGNYYRGYQITSEEDNDEAVQFNLLDFDNGEWLLADKYYDTLAHILRVAADYPLLFHLIINTLNIDPAQRMSARGIVDFLNKKCIPTTSERIYNVPSLPFFHNVTVGRLRMTFEESQFEVVHVGVLDCVRKDRCDFVRGKEYQIQIGFKPDRRVEQLKTAVWSHLGDAHGALTKFHMENENACIGSNITCPLEPGRTYWYRQSVSILREFPEVDVQVNWLLTSPEVAPRKDQKFPLQREVCVKFLGKVIGEEN